MIRATEIRATHHGSPVSDPGGPRAHWLLFEKGERGRGEEWRAEDAVVG